MEKDDISHDTSVRLVANNPIVVSKIISHIVQRLKNARDDNRKRAEFNHLLHQCSTANPCVREVACKAVLYLVKENVLEIKATLAELITLSTTKQCTPDITSLVNSLTLIDARNEVMSKGSYECHFSLHHTQHPFIVMLNVDPNCGQRIFNEIVFSYGSNDDEDLLCNKIYISLFKYIFCNPDVHHLTAFAQKLWTFLINNDATQTIVESLFSWMQIQTRNGVERNSDLLVELAEVNTEYNSFSLELLLLFEAAAVYEMILHNLDPRVVIASIAHVLKYCADLTVHDCILLILSKSIRWCSSVYLADLLALCDLIIHQQQCGSFPHYILKASVLQWMANSSLLTLDSIDTANALYKYIETKFNKIKYINSMSTFLSKFQKVLSTNSEVYGALQLCETFESWTNEMDVLDWLEKLEDTSTAFKFKLVHCLFGLLVAEFNDSSIHSKVFNFILQCSDVYSEISVNVLTLILYKLSNTTDSNLHMKLLKSLPRLGATKDNFPMVWATISAFSKGPRVIKDLSTNLMLDLWKLDDKYYTHLENMLIAPYDQPGSNWEFYISRAHILREICVLRPELYGKDMVAHLSRILNTCCASDKGINQGLACALSIEALASLCKSEVIDAVTTWASIAPMLVNDQRIPVIKSVCLLISEVPNLTYIDAYPKLSENCLSTLWDYINKHDNIEIWEASFQALAFFSVDQIMSSMPDNFLDEESLASRKEDGPISAQCWISFLQNCSSLTRAAVGNFLIKMISLEVSSYLKNVYHVKGPREPIDYSYLPPNSIVRTIGRHIKSKAQKWKGDNFENVYIECLRIFSHKYSKPLPPLDWCFLQELIHYEDAKNYCVDIASHQVMLSGTARRLMENYVLAVTENHTNEDDVSNIYRNLSHLANSIQPATLRPFLDVTISSAYHSFNSGSDQQLRKIVTYLTQILRNCEVQEANKTVIAQILTVIVEQTDIESSLFEMLMNCVVLFPTTCIDAISSPKVTKELTVSWYKRAVKIRSRLSLNSEDRPLNDLNELIDVGGAFPDLQLYTFEHYARVFKRHKDNTECALWILELIGQIQAAVNDKFDENQILFLCDVFILATVTFSGHFVFLKDFSSKEAIKSLFPQALASLLDENHWSVCTMQALEWLYHMNARKIFTQEYTNMFGKCLQALRHEDAFKKNTRWMKYLNVDC